MKDRLWVYTSVRDEEHLMPFFMRHYKTIADKIIVQDCGSTDKTCEIARAGGAEVKLTGEWGMDETRRRHESHQFVHEAAPRARWCIAVDADEFILGDFDRAFRDGEKANAEVLQTVGWTMTGNGFPEDDGRQIYEISNNGICAGAAKPCICRPGGDFLWSAGRHFIETQQTRIMHPLLHLLHFRYLGEIYTRIRNERNWARSPNKLTAFTCASDWVGHGSAKSAGEGAGKGINVMEAIAKMDYCELSAYAPHLDHTQMIKAA